MLEGEPRRVQQQPWRGAVHCRRGIELVADDRVRRALLLMEQHLADPLPIADIARRLQLSTRQLERLFQTVMGQRPAEFYRGLRLRYARFLLDTTGRSVMRTWLTEFCTETATRRSSGICCSISAEICRVRASGR